MNERERLIGYLNGRDAPCPGCGYNLRGLLGDRCPECGEALTVQGIKYRHRSAITPWFVAGCAGVVAGGVVLVAVWPVAWGWEILARGRPPGWDDLRFAALLGATLGLVVIGERWLGWADEMTKRSARFRAGWAVACWGTVPAAVLLGWIVGRW